MRYLQPDPFRLASVTVAGGQLCPRVPSAIKHHFAQHISLYLRRTEGYSGSSCANRQLNIRPHSQQRVIVLNKDLRCLFARRYTILSPQSRRPPYSFQVLGRAILYYLSKRGLLPTILCSRLGQIDRPVTHTIPWLAAAANMFR